MDVILTHENADFDAIAGLLGASKLYPEAIPVLPRNVNRNVRAFIALYGAEMPFVQLDDLPQRRKITHAVLVDTQGLVTIKGMGRDLQVTVIDHHARDADFPDDWTFCGESLGAATTLLVERIQAQALSVSEVEATLFMLGIYEDTGSLSYTSTTARDAQAVAWLMEREAHLDVLAEFLHHPLSPQQRDLYDQLMDQTATHVVEGHTVIIAWADAPDYGDEISTLAHRLRDLLEPAALFVLVKLDGRIQLVARSTTDDIDVSQIAVHFGGGGHRRASAALIRDRSLEGVRQALVDLLPGVVQAGTTVGQIMSRGVQVLTPRTTIGEAFERMRRTGHEGYPVVIAGNVIGLLTRRAVDRAIQFEMSDAAVTQVMKAGNVTVSPDDSVTHLQQMMIESGWGQIPVAQDNRVVGVVTRTDLITLWGAQPQATPRHEVTALLEEALSEPVLALVREISRVAHGMNFVPYFVGGLVRDLLVGTPIVDVDMVIEGNAIKLADRLADALGGRVIAHRRFGTAKWVLSKKVWHRVTVAVVSQEDVPPSIDFAAARTEFYIYPTALPKVALSSIKQDLHRRDFTINTLAIRLDPEHWGQLLDFYGGEADLRDGVLRVLHSLSFVDDPTRMLRAARLESRLGFQLDPRSEELIADALPLLKRVSGDRIRNELNQIFEEPEPERAMCRLQALGALAYIHPALTCDKWLQTAFVTLREELDFALWELDPENADDVVFLHWALLAYRLAEDQLEAMTTRLKMTRDDADDLQAMLDLKQELPRVGWRSRPSSIYRLLEPYHSRVLAAVWAATGSRRLRDRLQRYQARWRLVKPAITGSDLKAMGLKPGPLFGRLLETLRDARLDGKVEDRDQEEALLHKLLDDEGERSDEGA